MLCGAQASSFKNCDTIPKGDRSGHGHADAQLLQSGAKE